MSERWHDIPDYEGLYQVSTHGRVRGLDRIDGNGNRRGTKVLRPKLTSSGRAYYLFSREGVVQSHCASVLAARAYGLSNPRRCGYAIHRNGDNRDFRRANLAWATLAEQRMHDGLKTSSRYYGVSRHARSRGVLVWMAALRVEKRCRVLGHFATPEEAAYAYDREVKRLRLKRPLNGVRKSRRHEMKIASLPGEVWRPLPAAPRTHMISNRGRVKRLAYVAPNGQRLLPMLRKVNVDPRGGGRTICVHGRRYGIATLLRRVFG